MKKFLLTMVLASSLPMIALGQAPTLGKVYDKNGRHIGYTKTETRNGVKTTTQINSSGGVITTTKERIPTNGPKYSAGGLRLPATPPSKSSGKSSGKPSSKPSGKPTGSSRASGS